MSLPNNLKPKKNYLLSRIGKDNDGGVSSWEKK